ncbi:hypothetical protein [Novosphingobium mangrovi (ex Huang et al. 2023)]|uniref:Uncharacterized protein n=1 Tax=Novosphingobium mangrovi (ex Huang et al. 2023) TaxID=2976432 RepID=A0ABT2I3R1_9SPHN|nr:hypothetical protein [Novosphingobium mangrovi (ex Huang et al. 2023)]MCT2399450.1 hypothetical protein [Novosphingobium mangrovi (ex Huang et al. 2023)]
MHNDAHALHPTVREEDHRRARGPWLRLLSQVLDLAGPQADFLRHSERPWSSATFSGARHSIVVAFEGKDSMTQAEAYAAALPDHEFSIPGQIVADAAIVSAEHANGPRPRRTIEAEFLLLEDA